MANSAFAPRHRKSNGNAARSGYIFQQQKQDKDKGKAPPSPSLQASLADIRRKDQPLQKQQTQEHAEAEFRERDSQTWLVPEEQIEAIDLDVNLKKAYSATGAAGTSSKEARDDVSTGSNAGSPSMMECDLLASTTVESGVFSSPQSRSQSSIDEDDTYEEEEEEEDGDDETTKASKETYERCDDETAITKVSIHGDDNEDITLSNPASLVGSGTLSDLGTLTRDDVDMTLSYLQSKSRSLNGEYDDDDDDESTTTVGIIEAFSVADGMSSRPVRLETDLSTTVTANDDSTITVLVSPKYHRRQGSGSSHHSRRSRSSTMISYKSMDTSTTGSKHTRSNSNASSVIDAEIGAIALSTAASTLRSPTSSDLDSDYASVSSPSSPTSTAPWADQPGGTSTLLGSLLPGNADLQRGPSEILSSLESVVLAKVDSIERSIFRIVGLGGPDEIDDLERLATELDVLSDIMSADADECDTLVDDKVPDGRGEDSTLDKFDSQTFDTAETASPISAISALVANVQPETLRKEMQHLEKGNTPAYPSQRLPQLDCDHVDVVVEDEVGPEPAPTLFSKSEPLVTIESTQITSDTDTVGDENFVKDGALIDTNEETGELGIEYTLSTVVKESMVQEDELGTDEENDKEAALKNPVSTTHEEDATSMANEVVDQEIGIEYSLSRLATVPSKEEEEEEEESFAGMLLLSPRTEDLISEVAFDDGTMGAKKLIVPSASVDNIPASTASEPGFEISLQPVKSGTPAVKTPLLLCDESSAWEEVQRTESHEEHDCANADGEDTKNMKPRRRFSFKGAFASRLNLKTKPFSPRSNSSQNISCNISSVVSALTSPTNNPDVDVNADPDINKVSQKSALAEAKRLEAETRKVEASIRLVEARAAKAAALAAAEARRLKAESTKLKAEQQLALERAAKKVLREEALAEKIKELRLVAEEKLKQKQAKEARKEEARQIKLHKQQERAREAQRVDDIATAEKVAARKIKADEIERKRIEANLARDIAAAEKKTAAKAKQEEVERKRAEEYQANQLWNERKMVAQKAWEEELERREADERAKKKQAKEMELKSEIRQAKEEKRRAREELAELRRKEQEKKKWYLRKAKEEKRLAAQRLAADGAAKRQAARSQSFSAGASEVSRSIAAKMTSTTHAVATTANAVGDLVADLAKCTAPPPSATVDDRHPFSESNGINNMYCARTEIAIEKEKNTDLNIQQENNSAGGLTVALLRISRP